MTDEQEPLTQSVVLRLTHTLLTSNGFRVTRGIESTDLPVDRTLLAEDEYSVIALVTYETWSELASDWTSAQAELVALLGQRLARSAPKAWDGYLVLICLGTAPDAAEVSKIERDTTRVRKIVATADTVRLTADLERLLDPFLPLPLLSFSAEVTDILRSLPELLMADVPPRATEAVISAFRQLEPPLERLHQLGDEP